MPSTAKEFIKVYAKDTYRALSKIEKQQHPFALAKSITDVAEGAVEQVRVRTRQEFDLATNFVPRGVRKTSAKKRDVKNKGEATAVVFTMPIISGFMPIHEEGGARDPFRGRGVRSRPGGSSSRDKGKYFTIPSKMIEKKAYTGSGKVKKRFLPGQLLKNYQKSKGRNLGKGTPMIVRKRIGKRTPFIIRAGGAPKNEKRRRELEILHIFTTRASYKPVWDFEETVVAYVKRAFNTIYKRNLRRAVATAK